MGGWLQKNLIMTKAFRLGTSLMRIDSESDCTFDTCVYIEYTLQLRSLDAADAKMHIRQHLTCLQLEKRRRPMLDGLNFR